MASCGTIWGRLGPAAAAATAALLLAAAAAGQARVPMPPRADAATGAAGSRASRARGVASANQAGAAAATAAAGSGGQVAMVIAGRALSAAEYRRKLAALDAPLPESLPPALRRQEARSFLRFAMLLAAARRAGLQHNAAFQQRWRALGEKLLVKAFLARLQARAADIPPAMVTAYYRRHRSQYASLAPQEARSRIRGVLFHRRYRAAMAALRRAFRARLNGAYFAAPAQR